MNHSDRVHPFLWWLGLILLCAFASGCSSPPAVTAATPRWISTTWNGEAAWLSDSGEWRAIVSEHRARLIYFGPKDTATNLLYAPPTPQEFRPRGGHLFWLGPQSEWKGRWGVWPPPDEWEQQAARLVEIRNDWLHLTLPRPDNTRPQLSRAYRWIDGALHCRVAWSGGTGDHQAIQILQLPAQAIVEAQPANEFAPRFVRFDTTGKQQLVPEALGHSATLLSGTLRLQSHSEPDKYGFRPHTLHARLATHSLAIGRSPIEGIALASPDQGFDTQVYLGGKTFPFVELEQLTPRLQNRGETENAFTIWIKPRRL